MLRLLTASILLAACGGTEVEVGGSIALEDAPQRHAAAYCERLFSCCDAGDLAQKLAVLGDPPPVTVAECTVAYAAGLAPGYAQLAGDSRLLYSPQQMAACVAAITATECIDLDVAGEETFQRVCGLVFDGRIALGSPCAVPSDCRGAAICSGVCEPRAQENEPCETVGCDVALYCDTTRTCRATRRDGQSCVLSTDCQSTACDGMRCVPSGPHQCVGNP